MLRGGFMGLSFVDKIYISAPSGSAFPPHSLFPWKDEASIERPAGEIRPSGIDEGFHLLRPFGQDRGLDGLQGLPGPADIIDDKDALPPEARERRRIYFRLVVSALSRLRVIIEGGADGQNSYAKPERDQAGQDQAAALNAYDYVRSVAT